MVKEIILGTDLYEEFQKYDIILIGASIKNSKGNGFMHKMCNAFPNINKVNKETNYNDVRKLGTCQVVTTYVNQGFPIFILCYITKGRYRPDIQPDALDYDALKCCLELVNKNFNNKKIGMTLMGNSIFEGGGDSKRIYEIINNNLTNNEVYIYDYEQIDFTVEYNEKYNSIIQSYINKEISLEELRNLKSKFLWEKNFGLFLQPFPEGLSLTETKKLINRIKLAQNL